MGSADDKEPKSKRQKPPKPWPFAVVIVGVFAVLCLVIGAIFALYHAISGNPVPKQADQRLHRKLPSDSIYKLTLPDIDGKKVPLSRFAGMVTMVVNVASESAETQVSYNQMRELMERYGSKYKFAILIFPTDDYQQEKGSDKKIKRFVDTIIGDGAKDPNFALFAKSSLKDNPVYKAFQTHLKLEGSELVTGNFFKFLVDADGIARMRFTKKEPPLDFEGDIQQMLHDNSEAYHPLGGIAPWEQ